MSGRPSEMHDDFSEDLTALEPGEPAFEFVECDFGIDHRRQTTGHLGEALADVAHRRTERADDPVLLLEQLHQIEGGGWTRGGAAGDEAAAALERQQRAVEGLGADMLKYDVDALLARQLA